MNGPSLLLESDAAADETQTSPECRAEHLTKSAVPTLLLCLATLIDHRAGLVLRRQVAYVCWRSAVGACTSPTRHPAALGIRTSLTPRRIWAGTPRRSGPLRLRKAGRRHDTLRDMLMQGIAAPETGPAAADPLMGSSDLRKEKMSSKQAKLNQTDPERLSLNAFTRWHFLSLPSPQVPEGVTRRRFPGRMPEWQSADGSGEL